MEQHVREIADRLGRKGVIEEIPHGYQSRVFAVQDIIIKIVLNEDQAKKDCAVRDFLLKKGFPVPRTLQADFVHEPKYVVLERLPGKILRECPRQEQESAIKHLAELLRELHGITHEAYGGIDSSLDVKKPFLSWIEYLERRSKPLGAFWEQHKHLLEDDYGPCFCHGDVSESNILVHKGKVSGLIDFEHARWGCALHDNFSSTKSPIIQKCKELLYEDVKNAPKIVLLYQWLAATHQLKNLDKAHWRELTQEEALLRKQHYKKELQERTSIIENTLNNNLS